MNARRLPRAGGFGRAAPSRTTLALLGLAVLALAVEGCSSLGLGRGCSTCGGAGTGMVATARRLGQRVFHRNAGCSDCEAGLIGGGTVVDVAPPPVIAAPAAAVPVEVPAAGSPLPPSADEAPADLWPIEEGAKPSASLRSYRRGTSAEVAGRDNLSRASGREVAARATSDPLARFNATLEPPAAPGPEPAASPTPDESPPATATAPNDAKPNEEALDASSSHSIPAVLEIPPEPLTVPGSLAPGFARFENVEPKLAGGALPAESGWSWLVEQGYRTVLDLRPMDQIRQEEVARINASGLRYLALPVKDEAVGDPATLTLFAALVGPDASRPLYFFDADGSRAAVLWYLHKVVNLRDAPQDAVLQADAIGPRVPALWDRATALVEHLQPAPATSSVPAPEPPDSPVPDSDPAPTAAPKTAASSLEQKAEAVLETVASQLPTLSAVAPPVPSTVVPPAPSPPPPADPTAWRPYAALAATGLTVPLFFLGRTAVSHVVRPKASPSGSAHRPKSLPDASGA